MDLESISPAGDLSKCCSCNCCQSWDTSLKRKFAQMNKKCYVAPSQSDDSSVARIEIENECAAMREVLHSQQQQMQLLSGELEKERSASASAADEAMSMISRLQREKAEVQMEARQFKCYADEKMAHDQHELLVLEDLLHKKDLIIYSLTYEVEAYKHRLMSIGFTDYEAEGMILELDTGAGSPSNSQIGFASPQSSFEHPSLSYPSLKCDLNETRVLPVPENDAPSHLDKYAFGETPSSKEDFRNVECEIHQLERAHINNQMDDEYCTTKHFIEKAKVGQSPTWQSHARRFSNESSSSLLGMVKEMAQEDYSFSKKLDYTSDVDDGTNDRVYTVDSVQEVPCDDVVKINIGISTEYITASRESLATSEAGDTDIEKLYTRLQALEADRESLRQEISLMRTNKAQMMLMKEMSHLLYKRMSPRKQVSVTNKSLFWGFSIMSLLKWVVSVITWKRKPRRSKYMFNASVEDLGLLLLLDQSPCMMKQCVLRRLPFPGRESQTYVKY